MAKSNQKDYMGMISWSRLSCGAPQPMFGTEIKSNTPICIQITRAHVERGNRRTHVGEDIYPDPIPIIEVEMTPIQWAELLTSGNQYCGIPCTITRLDGKKTEKVEMCNIAEDYDIHTETTFDEFNTQLSGLEQYVSDIMKSGKPMGKTQMAELLHNLKCVRENTVKNVEYTKELFKEDMAKMVVKAKADVNAYAELRLQNLGVKCLMDENNGEVTAKLQ